MIKNFLKKKSSKDLFAISISTFSNQIIGLLRGFFVAKFLGPRDFGILKAIQLITMLDKFGSLGFRTVATREVAHIKGEGDMQRANIVRNSAYTGEFLLAGVLFLAGLTSALFFESFTIITAIILASGQLFSNKILGIFNTEAIIEKKIALYSKILFWSGLLSSLVIIVLVPHLKIYAVLGIPVVAAITSCLVYWYKIGTNLRFYYEKNEMKRLLKIGIPITIAVLGQGSFRYAERILVGSLLGFEALGLFSLATMPLGYMANLMRQIFKVRGVRVLELLGKQKFRDAHRMIVKETAILGILAVLLVPLLCIALDFLVSTFLHSYINAIPIVKIFILSLPFRMISGYFSIVIISSVVNKQSIMGPLNFANTAIFVATVFILKNFQAVSIINIAIVNVITQAVYHSFFLVLYKKFFIDVYLKKSEPAS
ncbi:MAG: oligosaccharide flippase family protein [bacterium]|nr:MAG: oligosaccharide flippase family protein [bacterium]